MKKFKTIWHYAIKFYESYYEMETDSMRVGNILFVGEINDLSYEIASEVAEIHPNCLEYEKYAMTTLFRGKGKYSRTENPILAIESLKTKKESEIDMPYILIWKIYGDDKQYY